MMKCSCVETAQADREHMLTFDKRLARRACPRRTKSVGDSTHTSLYGSPHCRSG